MITSTTSQATAETRIDTTVAFGSILTDEYRSERADPRPGQPYYLILSDLAIALRKFGSEEHLRVLDYGCGPSPYRALFPNADYRRADTLDVPGLDYRIGLDQSIPERSEFFDVVLSTQVLEHVAAPLLYLAECRRLLRPGGRLILSTHGIFPEHGLPYDFQRWTNNGLVRALEQAGFDVTHSYRLTTNGRALAFLFKEYGAMLVRSRRSVLSMAFWCVNRLVANRVRWFHEWCDATFAESRVVDGSSSGHVLTIGLLCDAVRRA